MDALRCAPFSGDPRWLASSAHAQARARIDILFWEAGASALQLPELGPWLWGSEQAFGALIGAPARGTLRGRVLAARTVETCAGGIPLEDPNAVSRTLQVLQPLLLHPDALVWVHASRAVGRIAGRVEALQGTLLDWLQGESALLRQRAATAFASQGPERLRSIARELDARIDDPTAEATVLGAFAAATPYLISDRRESWERLSARILAGDGGDVSARALARGLGTLWRRGVHQDAVEAPMRALRERVRRSRSESLDVWRRWLDVLSATDPIDGAERDPLDVEQGLENLVRLAAQYDDEESDARAARFAGTLAGTFREACRVVLMDASPRRRAAGVNAVEGTARSLALGLWGPLLATAPAGSPVPEPDLRETWEEIANAPEVFLDTVASRRRGRPSGPRDRGGPGGARAARRELRPGRVRRGARPRPAARSRGAPHVPLAAQGRRPRRRRARPPGPAAQRDERAALAPRRHHPRHGAGRDRRPALARPLRGVVGAGHRPAHDAAAARQRVAHDRPRGAGVLLRAGRGDPRGGVGRGRAGDDLGRRAGGRVADASEGVGGHLARPGARRAEGPARGRHRARRGPHGAGRRARGLRVGVGVEARPGAAVPRPGARGGAAAVGPRRPGDGPPRPTAVHQREGPAHHRAGVAGDSSAGPLDPRGVVRVAGSGDLGAGGGRGDRRGATNAAAAAAAEARRAEDHRGLRAPALPRARRRAPCGSCASPARTGISC